MSKKINEDMMKKSVISGASHALRFKEQNPSYSDEDVLKKVVRELKNIIEKIDRE